MGGIQPTYGSGIRHWSFVWNISRIEILIIDLFRRWSLKIIYNFFLIKYDPSIFDYWNVTPSTPMIYDPGVKFDRKSPIWIRSLKSNYRLSQWNMTPAKFDPLLTEKINMFIWSLKNENKFIPLIEPFVHWDDIGVKSDSIQKSNFHAHPLEFTIWQFMFIPFWNLKFYFIHLSKISTFWKCPFFKNDHFSKMSTFQKYPLFGSVHFWKISTFW